MDVTSFFYDALDSDNLYELADHLESLIKHLKSVENKMKIIDECYSLLSDECFYEGEAAGHFIKIFSVKDSIPEFLYNHWTFSDTAEENFVRLESIVHKIRNYMIAPKAPRISDRTICDLVDLVERKFQYGTKVLKEHPVKILKINQTYKGWGCYYIAGTSNGEIAKDAIIMTCPNNPEAPQEFGFIHELGHRLHTSLTYQTFVPPASFACFREYLPEPIQDDRSMSEHFANFFAIAALNNSPYEHCIPHKVSTADIAVFEKYMSITIATMDENVIHTIDELHNKAKYLGINL